MTPSRNPAQTGVGLGGCSVCACLTPAPAPPITEHHGSLGRGLRTTGARARSGHRRLLLPTPAGAGEPRPVRSLPPATSPHDHRGRLQQPPRMVVERRPEPSGPSPQGTSGGCGYGHLWPRPSPGHLPALPRPTRPHRLISGHGMPIVGIRGAHLRPLPAADNL